MRVAREGWGGKAQVYFCYGYLAFINTCFPYSSVPVSAPLLCSLVPQPCSESRSPGGFLWGGYGEVGHLPTTHIPLLSSSVFYQRREAQAIELLLSALLGRERAGFPAEKPQSLLHGQSWLRSVLFLLAFCQGGFFPWSLYAF